MAVKLMTGTFAPDARRPSCEKDNIHTVLSAPAAYPDAFNSRGRQEEMKDNCYYKSRTGNRPVLPALRPKTNF